MPKQLDTIDNLHQGLPASAYKAGQRDSKTLAENIETNNKAISEFLQGKR